MRIKRHTLFLAGFLAASPLLATLKSDPETFEYGWAPDNARIFSEFTIKNTGNDAIGLQALKPACGCTAAKFQPMSLASEADTKISLTFNTRGYKGHSFNKSAELTTNDNQGNILVYLKGHVMNPNAGLQPTGSGIAAFGPDRNTNTEKITLQNKTDKDLKLSIVQPSASWAKVKLGAETIPAGQSTTVTIQVSGSFDQVRETSLTIEGVGADSPQRATLAVRTGPAPREHQPIRPSNPAVSPSGSGQGGYNDPLKLKPIEPVKSK